MLWRGSRQRRDPQMRMLRSAGGSKIWSYATESRMQLVLQDIDKHCRGSSFVVSMLMHCQLNTAAVCSTLLIAHFAGHRKLFVCHLLLKARSCYCAGSKVSDTIRKGIIDITPYQNETSLLMVGNVAALSGQSHYCLACLLCKKWYRMCKSFIQGVEHFWKSWKSTGIIFPSWKSLEIYWKLAKSPGNFLADSKLLYFTVLV